MTTPADAPAYGWILLTYKVPAQPSRIRVAVWRDLKRIGALYIQQAVCVLPDVPDIAEKIDALRTRISDLDGSSFSARLTDLSDADTAFLVAGFRENSEREYAEIIEECRTKFVQEIEFERYRQNFTYEEAEEIGHDLEKLRRWLARILERDWMNAPGRDVATEEVEACARLLEDFEAEVFARSGQEG